MGTFVDDIMYCFHLLDVVNTSPVIQSVILSVSNNFKQLAITFLLGIIIIFIYTITGFYFFSEDFYKGDIAFSDNAGENMCSGYFFNIKKNNK